jgi:broad specificity phosphatase PhoE
MRLRLLLAVLFLGLAATAHAQRAVIVLRHAEKADNSEDSPLSPQGFERAKTLARALRDAEISAVYVSQYRRTLQTAQPLLEHLNLKPVSIRADDIANLVLKIRADNAGQVVLVVGHSDTVPDIVRAFGYLDPVKVDSSEFDNLFIVVPRSGEKPVLIRLRY